MAYPSEVKDFLVSTFKNAITNNKERIPPMLIIGDAGIGKSRIVGQVASELGIVLRDRRLSQFPDSGDLIGIPRMSESGLMEHSRPAWLPSEDEGYNILFLDEFNRALLDVRQAAFQLLTEWRINTHKISPKTFLVMAINRDDGENFVNPLDRATLSRMVHINMTVSADDWFMWARKENINPLVINFLVQNNRYLYPTLPEDSTKPFACPRTWEFVSNLLDLGVQSQSMFEESIVGCLGLEVGSSFCSYLKKQTIKVLSGYQIIDEYPSFKKYVKEYYNPNLYESSNRDLKNVLCQFQKENIPLNFMQNLNLFYYLSDASKEVAYVCIKDLLSTKDKRNNCTLLFLEETVRHPGTKDRWKELFDSLEIKYE